jgi:hypothetical protein
MSTQDIDAWIDAMSALLTLPVAPEHRAGVAMNLKVAQQAHEALAFYPEDDHAEPAALYHPEGASDA